MQAPCSLAAHVLRPVGGQHLPVWDAQAGLITCLRVTPYWMQASRDFGAFCRKLLGVSARCAWGHARKQCTCLCAVQQGIGVPSSQW